MIEWPQQLIEDLARRRCVIFVGSGVSKNSKNEEGRSPKDWQHFLKDVSTKMPDQSDRRLFNRLIKEKDYLTACELVKECLGEEDFIQCVEEEYLQPAYRSAEIHKYIFELDSRIVVTPNFDKIYETYAGHVSEGTVKVKNYHADDIANVIRGKRTDRIIIKMHGTVDEPNKLIFSRREYVEARSKHRDFYSLLESLIMTHTFIFLGCGLDDPDIKLLLEDYAHRFRFSRSHYFVTRKRAVDDKIKSIVSSTMRLRFLEYSGTGGDHSKLSKSLERLVEMVEQDKASIVSKQDW